ncbi:MAG TPA: 3-deoxy-7-phosphoheptulonate synthase [Caldilineales bacterium]|nr:3-deoxy-7-phosphoheptulonate synthase [Caldilineales bacterium]
MIVIMKPTATEEELQRVLERVERLGLEAHLSSGESHTIIGLIGETGRISRNTFEVMPGVERVVRIAEPFKLANREFHPQDTLIQVGDVTIGGEQIVIMAGPCSVESRSQLLETAHAVKEAGAHILRGGAFKPRSSPYAFQGLGEEGLKYLAEAREIYGMPIITEVMATEEVELVARYADILQIGARNMQNYRLLQAVGRQQKPVFLKRGLSGTLQELLMSAEYVIANGNPNVMVVERGIRTYETFTRNTFDINAIPALKQLTHLPVIGDPSHGTGKWRLVGAVAKAAIAAGADGLMIEVHPRPDEAFSDGAQSLKPKRFQALMDELRALAQAIGRAM